MKEKNRIAMEIETNKAEVYPQVDEREGGCCISCGRPAVEVHEIEQKSHHPRSKQIEKGTFSLENCVAVCRKCHDLLGQSQFGGLYFKVRLHILYDYDRPDLSWWG